MSRLPSLVRVAGHFALVGAAAYCGIAVMVFAAAVWLKTQQGRRSESVRPSG